jgi:hypothetical protein
MGVEIEGETTNNHVVKISYMGIQSGYLGRHLTHTLQTKYLARKDFLPPPEVLLKQAKNTDVAIDIDLQSYFRPTGAIQAALRDESLKDMYKGIHVDALTIIGKFEQNITREQRVQWWKDVQRLITYLGLVFRPYAEVRCELVKPGFFNKAALFEMKGMEVGIDGLVFE